MIQRDDLRLSVCVGLAAGLGSISTVPDGYYLPLTLAAVMVGSYGSSYALGVQRVICTLLGGLLLLIAQPAFTSLPFPIGLALMLALLALNLFWSSTAISTQHRCFAALLDLQRQALEEQRLLLVDPDRHRLSPVPRKQRHRELMQALIRSRGSRAAAVIELGANPYSQPQIHLWTDLERCCAGLTGCLTALRALREPLQVSGVLGALQQAEAQLLADCVWLLGQWQRALQNDRPAMPPGASAVALQAAMDRLRQGEETLLAALDLSLGLDRAQQHQVTRRLLLCYQLGSLVQRMQVRWLELIPSRQRYQ